VTAPLLCHPDFLSPAACEALITFFERHIARLGGPDVSPAFSHRVIRFRRLIDAAPEHSEVVRLMSVVRFLASQRIAEFFREGMVLPEETQIVAWPPGSHQPLHRDTLRSTTTYVSLCYLNDGFAGGRTFFPGHPGVEPRAGMMLAFHGARLEHGVTMVQSGMRYTMPIWFTADPEAIEA
jgi:hypothetical protein